MGLRCYACDRPDSNPDSMTDRYYCHTCMEVILNSLPNKGLTSEDLDGILEDDFDGEEMT